MLRIAGAPVTEHQIRKAQAAGITEIVLATSYLSDVFRPHFGDGERFGVKIKYSHEEVALGTAGAIAMGAAQLELEPGESVFIFNGDVLSAHDLQTQRQLHLEREADVTLHLTKVSDARAYGCVPIDSDGRVHEFLEKMENPKADTINAGCYIFGANALAAIPSGVVTSVERDTFPKLLAAGARVFGYEDSRYWIDMGTPNSMIKASRDLILRPELSLAVPGVTGAALIESGGEISSTAEITGGSYLESGVSVGENATISGSIVGAGAQIEAEVLIEDSYIAAGTRVISGSRISGEVFGF